MSGVVGATPASSDPYWEEVTVTPQFHCTTSTEPGFYEASTCVVVSGDTARSVAIVTNLADAPITVDQAGSMLVINGIATLYTTSPTQEMCT